MALINALRSSFSNSKVGQLLYMYMCFIDSSLSLCVNKAIESTFSNTQLTIFLLPTHSLHPPTIFSPSHSPM